MTNQKAPDQMNAVEAMEAYGLVKDADSDVWIHGTADTQSWQKVNGGWRRIERPAPGLVIGARPWGRPFGGANSGLIEVPYTQTAKYDGVSGLHPETHPEAFEWTWPEAKVAEIYAYGYTPEYGKRWKRNDEGELVQDRSPVNAKAED